LSQIYQLGKDKGKYVCGLVYFSHFLCNAIADPNTARITGGRFLPMRVRRNFQIVATVLRSALGIPKCDPALDLSSDVQRDIRGKLESFLDQAIKSKSMSVGDSMIFFPAPLPPPSFLPSFGLRLVLGIINEVSTKPMNNFHKFILHNQQVILKNFKEEPVALGTHPFKLLTLFLFVMFVFDFFLFF
jgi:hypothetical protein